MRKSIYTLTTLILSFSLVFSQTSSSKLDLRLRKRLLDGDIRNQNIPLLVKGDLEKIKQLTEKLQGTYKYGYNNISSISIPEKNALAFSVNPAVETIENTNMKAVFLMDSARIRNNIDSAQAGYAPLPDSMKGKNVLVGIIDGGIYWQHPDFKHPDGTTRIRYIWDQTISGTNTPQPYNYGSEWSWVAINSGNCTAVDPYTGSCSDFSHGTCVAGIAAGNGRSDSANPHLAGKYTGVAPESDIIFVSIGAGSCVNDVATQVADAVDYIFKKADALGMPCVINTSVGTYYGSHDGKDLTTKLIENLLDQRNGRVLVAAAGNGGSIPHHVSYNVPADSAYTYFKYNPNGTYFDFWADTANFNHASFSVHCSDRYGNGLGRTEYFNMTTNFIPAPPSYTAYVQRSPFYGPTALGSIQLQCTLDSGRYHVEVLITPDSTSFLWSLQTTGTGTLDYWASSGLIGSSDMVDSLPTPGSGNVYISDSHYHHGDLNKTIVSGWQCSDKVITVGNYSNRAGYFDYDSNYVDLTAPGYGEIVGKRFGTSSFGPTRDNRLKPDVMATGSTTLCTGDANDITLKLNNGLHYKVALGGKHERNGGTSMSSPLVAGIAALYLQKRPTATYDEVKKILICTAVKDSFTGPVANNEYGNGKVNAFQALINTTCITYGALDTACINYNVLANVDTGGCVAKIYGCTDPVASNYDSTANVSNGNCIYITGIKNMNSTVSLKVNPNPFTDQTIFSFVNEGYVYEKGEIQILNELGEVTDVMAVSKYSGNYVYLNTKLAKGIYFYRLKLDEKIAKAGKLVVE